MRSERIFMTWDEFNRLPRRLGWKHEYWDGHAHLTPGHTIVSVQVEVSLCEVASAWPLRPVVPEDEAALVPLYVAAFGDTVEYCDWKWRKIAAAARENIQGFFAGKRGAPLPASLVALAPPSGHGGETIIGASLVVEPPQSRPMLDLLFIRPDWHRHGVSSALVSASLAELHRAGKTTLRSRYHLANEASRAWHRRFGFVEQPDLFLAKHYHTFAWYELDRRKEAGDLSEAEHAELLAEIERLKARVEELEEIGRREGFDAVLPLLHEP
jgi:RimJ/RimL family protein N-acetyltransferase